MPDIVIDHVHTPTRSSELGAKGAGEAGTAGAPAAIMNAINDAIAPLGANVSTQPFTPERVLQACKTRSGVKGWVLTFAPKGAIASLIAFMMAAGAPAVPASPAPFAPSSELRVGVCT